MDMNTSRTDIDTHATPLVPLTDAQIELESSQYAAGEWGPDMAKLAVFRAGMVRYREMQRIAAGPQAESSGKATA